MKRAFFGLFTLSFLLPPGILRADDLVVNPHYLVSDAEMLDVYSMSLLDIERFLIRGTLDEYVVADINGIQRSAAEIIYNASQEFDLSPRFLLTLLQKEQSLVEDDIPTQDQFDWAMGYGVCDDCSKDDSQLQKFKGFGQQVYYAAQRIRESYLHDLASRGYTETGIGPGIETFIDDTYVIPVNDATAVLYTYTPHLSGNELFAVIWNRWFTYEYLTGSLLQDKETGGIWLIQYGQRRPITSRAAFLSRFSSRTVIQVSSTTLEAYPIGTPISFPNYSLLRSPGGTVYLIVDDTRRGFVSQEAFRSLGFVSDEIIDVTWEDLNAYTEGQPITVASQYAQWVLLQDQTTGGVFWVEDGKKHPLFSREILEARFPNPSLISTSTEDLNAFETADPILFQDGTLIGVQGSTDVFVVSEGKRRHIVDELTFYSYGWDWSQIVWTTERAVLEHPLTEPLMLNTSFEEDDVSVATTSL